MAALAIFVVMFIIVLVVDIIKNTRSGNNNDWINTPKEK